MALQRANKDTVQGFKFLKAGDNLKGYYQGQAKKTINGTEAIEHTYRTTSGILSILGQANILSQIKNNNIDPGTYVEITYSGEQTRLKNGRSMKVYHVDFDREDTDGALTPSHSVSSNEDESESYVTPPSSNGTDSAALSKVKAALASRTVSK